MSGLLRQATEHDISGMHRVRLAVHENMTSGAIRVEHYLSEIEVSGRGWVIVDGQEVVAFAVGNRETASIWALFVHPGHEGKGYGRLLQAAAVEWLFAQGVHRIWLSTSPGTRAQYFYEAAGWKFCRVLPSGKLYYELQQERAAADRGCLASHDDV
jgi:GNAT superfamily N-acetyltransferase